MKAKLMNIEFEAKFFVNHDVMRKTLQQLGAKLIKSKTLMRRTIFAVSISEDISWLRVRDEGDCVTLTLKSDNGKQQIDSIKELELNVSDYDVAVAMLAQLGYPVVNYIENYREAWQLGSC